MSETRVHLSKTEPAAYQALDAFSKTVGQICAANGIDERLKELVMIHCSQLNGCAYCARIHVDRAVAAGVDIDTLTQIPTWRESGVFSDRERAALELAEAFTFIAEDGISDEVYDQVVGGRGARGLPRGGSRRRSDREHHRALLRIPRVRAAARHRP
ncbi:carboxymuconolactone decarboxylase family protein [Microbacterium sp. BF1]|uniref:carboxymuconolactone decarboxylase family protein n=1 Tax=Microbacterium sp. BF1 TaxID=2821146 RepID=UPI00211A7241|nr:carboxymuconolactone decarboxylase family protein [Microbacterium sp. BF1]